MKRWAPQKPSPPAAKFGSFTGWKWGFNMFQNYSSTKTGTTHDAADVFRCKWWNCFTHFTLPICWGARRTLRWILKKQVGRCDNKSMVVLVFVHDDHDHHDHQLSNTIKCHKIRWDAVNSCLWVTLWYFCHFLEDYEGIMVEVDTDLQKSRYSFQFCLVDVGFKNNMSFCETS